MQTIRGKFNNVQDKRQIGQGKGKDAASAEEEALVGVTRADGSPTLSTVLRLLQHTQPAHFDFAIHFVRPAPSAVDRQQVVDANAK